MSLVRPRHEAWGMRSSRLTCRVGQQAGHHRARRAASGRGERVRRSGGRRWLAHAASHVAQMPALPCSACSRAAAQRRPQHSAGRWCCSGLRPGLPLGALVAVPPAHVLVLASQHLGLVAPAMRRLAPGVLCSKSGVARAAAGDSGATRAPLEPGAATALLACLAGRPRGLRCVGAGQARPSGRGRRASGSFLFMRGKLTSSHKHTKEAADLQVLVLVAPVSVVGKGDVGVVRRALQAQDGRRRGAGAGPRDAGEVGKVEDGVDVGDLQRRQASGGGEGGRSAGSASGGGRRARLSLQYRAAPLPQPRLPPRQPPPALCSCRPHLAGEHAERLHEGQHGVGHTPLGGGVAWADGRRVPAALQPLGDVVHPQRAVEHLQGQQRGATRSRGEPHAHRRAFEWVAMLWQGGAGRPGRLAQRGSGRGAAVLPACPCWNSQSAVRPHERGTWKRSMSPSQSSNIMEERSTSSCRAGGEGVRETPCSAPRRAANMPAVAGSTSPWRRSAAAAAAAGFCPPSQALCLPLLLLLPRTPTHMSDTAVLPWQQVPPDKVQVERRLRQLRVAAEGGVGAGTKEQPHAGSGSARGRGSLAGTSGGHPSVAVQLPAPPHAPASTPRIDGWHHWTRCFGCPLTSRTAASSAGS